MSQVPPTRQSLLIQLGRRSDDAWAEFLVVYENAIVRFCRKMGLQDADARDATQEVLFAVHDKIPSWDHDVQKGSFRAFLFRVARNVAVDAIAARARRLPLTTDTEVERMHAARAAQQKQHETVLDAEFRRSLFEWAAQQVQAEVRPVTWQVFELTAIRGQSADQVAAQLKISVGNVYTAKCRVVARIRARIAELGEDFVLSPEADLDAKEGGDGSWFSNNLPND